MAWDTMTGALQDILEYLDRKLIQELGMELRAAWREMPSDPILLEARNALEDLLAMLLNASHREEEQPPTEVANCYHRVRQFVSGWGTGLQDIMRMRGPCQPQATPPLPCFPTRVVHLVYAHLDYAPTPDDSTHLTDPRTRDGAVVQDRVGRGGANCTG